MRPWGRKASRHGSSNVVTVVMVKGRSGSGFCWPTLTCAQPVADARVKSNAVSAKRIVISPYLSLLLELQTLCDTGTVLLLVHSLYHLGIGIDTALPAPRSAIAAAVVLRRSESATIDEVAKPLG